MLWRGRPVIAAEPPHLEIAMHPIAFHIGAHPVYWYGIMAAAGFLAATAHWSLLARREKRPPGFGSDLAFWLMAGGIIGARIAYVIADLPYYLDHPAAIWRMDQGGLIFYGGLLGGIAAFFIFAARRRLAVPSLADFAVSGLPLGHAIGRIGCFLNGCCYGTECSLPWSVYLHDAFRHPTQLYESAGNFAIYALLLWLYLRRPRPGTVLAAYLMLYPALRFMDEFVRGDERLRFLGLTVAQDISLLLFATGLTLMILLHRRKKRTA